MHGTTFAGTHWPSANWLTRTRTLKNWLPWHRTPRSGTPRTWTFRCKLTGRGTRRVRGRGTNGRLVNRTRSRLRHNHARAGLRPLRDRPSWSWRLQCRRGWLDCWWRSGLRRRGTRWHRSGRSRRTRHWSRRRWRRCRRLRLHRSRDCVRRPGLAGRHNSFGRGRRNGNRSRWRRNRWPCHDGRGRHGLFQRWRRGRP